MLIDMKLRTVTGTVVAGGLLIAGFTVLNSGADPGDTPSGAPATGRLGPGRKQPKPTTADGTWAYLTGSWYTGSRADFIYTVTGPSGGKRGGGARSENPYHTVIQVRLGDTITLTVRAWSERGRALCQIRAFGESAQGIPKPARQDNGDRDNGTVTCVRTVTWTAGNP
jgi:hypothetical protein